LVALTTQTIAGLIAREVTHAERAAGKPEQFREAILTQYQKHFELISSKLLFSNLIEPAKRSATARRDELLALADCPNLAADVAKLTATWAETAESLALQILA
jgi:hypothetical protein